MEKPIAFKTTIAALFVASAAYGQVYNRPEPKAGFDYSPTFCTNQGVRVELHQKSCLFVDGRTTLASCEMSMNNPIWRTTGESCDPRVRYEDRSPAGEPGSTHTDF